MRTDDLAVMLSTGVGRVDVNGPRRYLVSAVGWGGLGAVLLMLALLGLNPELQRVAQLGKFWGKIGFVAAIAGAAWWSVARLSRPGARVGGAPVALALPILAMFAWAAVVLAGADSDGRAILFFGNTWAVCPLLIAMLAAPVFGAVLWAMRELAPTRLRAAGAAAGALSGAVGALAYAFHCPEIEPPFIAFWYSLGILIPVIAGMLMGRKVLRW
jgi:hypothetical protein